ncbi:YslB family protein [Fructobacillus papyrifericola]|uniref:YslB family protein n=1 Tax=Fructobacillus papyrifericola TaxID=2713172 RepID=A0ABS5QSS4_9LACO|nr:YslB family protein [Fructobacillus papyrifericola]MBS9336248.1 YslB family protein [Fructobacillus papyrifericola]
MPNARSNQTIGSTRSENAFASLLLRDGLLQNLLTDDYANITYWAGKELARQFPLESIAEITDFFEKAGFGDLTITYQGEAEQQWVLSGPVVADRLALNRQADFSLEAGFLAQQVELQYEAVSESYFQVVNRKHAVTITIMADSDHKIDSLTASEQVGLRDRFFDLMDEKTEAVNEQIENSGSIKPASESHMIDEDAAVSEAEALSQTAVNSVSEIEKNSQSQLSQAAAEESVAQVAADTEDVMLDEEELSVQQSITNSLLAFDPKAKKRGDSKTALDF